ncbi:MAG: hypothetical protein ACRDUV_15130 [Pseudonocardiaceae bacterium]
MKRHLATLVLTFSIAGLVAGRQLPRGQLPPGSGPERGDGLGSNHPARGS